VASTIRGGSASPEGMGRYSWERWPSGGSAWGLVVPLWYRLLRPMRPDRRGRGRGGRGGRSGTHRELPGPSAASACSTRTRVLGDTEESTGMTLVASETYAGGAPAIVLGIPWNECVSLRPLEAPSARNRRLGALAAEGRCHRTTAAQRPRERNVSATPTERAAARPR